jgi:hypothetical protein
VETAPSRKIAIERQAAARSALFFTFGRSAAASIKPASSGEAYLALLWPGGLRQIPARLCEAYLAIRVAEVELRDATFDRTAASFEKPDHVAIVIRNYSWRLGLAGGEPKYDDLEKRLAEGPVITAPTITLEGDANGAPHSEPAAYRSKFSGKYEHRLITGGVGHNLPKGAPQAFAKRSSTSPKSNRRSPALASSRPSSIATFYQFQSESDPQIIDFALLSRRTPSVFGN